MLRFTILAVFLTYVYAEKAATVYIYDPSGVNNVTGNVNFTKESDGIHVTGTLQGLSAGKHGFHIHELGVIEPGCTSAGGHFNPHNLTHGAPNDTIRHVGDLGNTLEVGDSGVVSIDIIDSIIDLEGDHNIIGRTVVVHEGEDDLGKGNNSDSLVTGNAGGRLACGIIKILDNGSSAIFKSNSLIFTIAIILGYGIRIFL